MQSSDSFPAMSPRAVVALEKYLKRDCDCDSDVAVGKVGVFPARLGRRVGELSCMPAVSRRKGGVGRVGVISTQYSVVADPIPCWAVGSHKYHLSTAFSTV